jgi:ABC-type polysaccharide/polyol phosphate export permease
LVRRFFSFLGNLHKNRYMIMSLAGRELKQQYTGSFLGVIWAVIHPLVMVMLYYFVFSFVFGPKVKASYGTDSFALWLLCGLVPWFYFNGSVGRASGAVVLNKSLVTKTQFPSEVFPVVIIMANVVGHAVGLMMVLITIILTGGGLTPYVLLVPVYFVLMSVMVLGLGWIFSSLNVFVRDVGPLVTILLSFLNFFTPIFWPPSIIPEQFRGILELNPLFHVVEGYRACIISGTFPGVMSLAYLTVFTAFVFITGGLLFKRLKPAFADVL